LSHIYTNAMRLEKAKVKRVYQLDILFALKFEKFKKIIEALSWIVT